jgi:hypothetical protein
MNRNRDRMREALFSPPNLAGTAAAFGGFDSNGLAQSAGIVYIEPQEAVAGLFNLTTLVFCLRHITI